MKKKLDTDQITNELKGQSLYFEDQSKRLSKKSDEKDANARTGERANARTHVNGRTDERVNERTHERVNARTRERVNGRTHERGTRERANGCSKNAKRIIKRHSYQFYADQVEDMKKLVAQLPGTRYGYRSSDLAREAFDEYLTRIKEKANESRERTNE